MSGGVASAHTLAPRGGDQSPHPSGRRRTKTEALNAHEDQGHDQDHAHQGGGQGHQDGTERKGSRTSIGTDQKGRVGIGVVVCVR